MTPRITAVSFVRDFTLHLCFADGTEGDVDLARELDGEVFLPLRDPAFFRRFCLDPELHTVVWPNGADLAPEFLYQQAKAFAAIAREIRQWDPYDLLAGHAPKDEWDGEITELVGKIPRIQSPSDAVEAISQVFFRSISTGGLRAKRLRRGRKTVVFRTRGIRNQVSLAQIRIISSHSTGIPVAID